MASESEPGLHPDLEPLAPLLGTWAGDGTGVYPTIEPFGYTESLRIGHRGRPFLTWLQKTRASTDGRPLHTETGYLRCRDVGRGSPVVELVVAHPTGHVEVSEGRLERSDLEISDVGPEVGSGDVVISAATRERITALTIGLESTAVVGSGSAKQVDSLERRLRVEGPVLTYVLLMGAVGQTHQTHLRATLRRADS